MAQRASIDALVKKVPRGYFYAQVQDESNEDSIRFYQNNYTTRASASKGIVTAFLQYLRLTSQDRLLIVGAKGGYLEFLASLLCTEVYVVDVNADVIAITDQNLKAASKEVLEQLAIKVGVIHLVHYKDILDGYREKRPWSKILVTSAVKEVPPMLLDSLSEGGRLVAPLIRSEKDQAMVVYEKQQGVVHAEDVMKVIFSSLDIRWTESTTAAATPTAPKIFPKPKVTSSPQTQPPSQPQVQPPVDPAAQKQCSQQLLEKFGRIMKITNKVKLAMVATSLKVTPEDLFEYLVEWGNEQIPFKIEDDVIIVDNVSDFTQTLDRKFQEWNQQAYDMDNKR